MRSPLAGLVLATLLTAAGLAQACEKPPQPRLPTGSLTISAGGGARHRFTVEVARGAEEQSCGLMLRQRMGQDEGMIFLNDPPRPVAFWMKNTVLPLDLVFILADGRIAQISENATPFSEATIESRYPVAIVLELLAGTARRLGLHAGDHVTVSLPSG
jgi:uncharacterized membrane protein (UPF0127 family)